MDTQALVDAEAAALAFERSSEYEWQGQEITWGHGQHWFWKSVIRRLESDFEMDAMAGVWIGRMEAKQLRKTRKFWRTNHLAILDDIEEFSDSYNPDGEEVKEAVTVMSQIITDLNSSTDELAESDGEEIEGLPKKSVP